jgi:hypothetical protein
MLTGQSPGFERAPFRTARVSKPGVENKVTERSSNTLPSGGNAWGVYVGFSKVNSHRNSSCAGEPLEKVKRWSCGARLDPSDRRLRRPHSLGKLALSQPGSTPILCELETQ